MSGQDSAHDSDAQLICALFAQPCHLDYIFQPLLRSDQTEIGYHIGYGGYAVRPKRNAVPDWDHCGATLDPGHKASGIFPLILVGKYYPWRAKRKRVKREPAQNVGLAALVDGRHVWLKQAEQLWPKVPPIPRRRILHMQDIGPDAHNVPIQNDGIREAPFSP
jgi:hypothetical protein